jgi:hypothetical protein
MKTRYKFLIGIAIVGCLITLDKLQVISLLSWLRNCIEFLGGNPKVVLKKETVFSSEVYGGIIQGMIAALAVWVAYWTYNRQQKQVLRDQLFQKRVEIYPIIYTKCLDFYSKLRNTDYRKHSVKEIEEMCNEIYFFPEEIRYSYGVLISNDLYAAIRFFRWEGLSYLEFIRKNKVYIDAIDDPTYRLIKTDLYEEILLEEEPDIQVKLFRLELNELGLVFSLSLDRVLNVMRDELGIDPLTNDIKSAVESNRFREKGSIYSHSDYYDRESVYKCLDKIQKHKEKLQKEIESAKGGSGNGQKSQASESSLD